MVGVKKGKKTRKPVERSAEDYFEEAELAFMSDDYDTARTNFKTALDMEPENTEFLSSYAMFLAECGPIEEAVPLLNKACELDPDTFSNWMYLGQVLDSNDQPTEAQAAIRKGIELIRKDLAQAEQREQEEKNKPIKKLPSENEFGSEENYEATSEEIKCMLASALCTLGELILSAAAEPEVQEGDMTAMLQQAEQILGEARMLDPTLPDPVQAMCSLRRLQDKQDEALALLKESMAMWFKPMHSSEPKEPKQKRQQQPKADADSSDEEEESEWEEASSDGDDDGDMDLDEENMPSYEFRFETAKLLLELDETTEAAVQLLENLLAENDTVPDVWLLLTVAYRAGGELEAALEAAEEGCEIVAALKLPEDDDVVVALNGLKGELETMIGEEEEEGGDDDADEEDDGGEK